MVAGCPSDQMLNLPLCNMWVNTSYLEFIKSSISLVDGLDERCQKLEFICRYVGGNANGEGVYVQQAQLDCSLRLKMVVC